MRGDDVRDSRVLGLAGRIYSFLVELGAYLSMDLYFPETLGHNNMVILLRHCCVRRGRHCARGTRGLHIWVPSDQYMVTLLGPKSNSVQIRKSWPFNDVLESFVRVR